MKVLFVSAEVTPYAKTGGLGDVSAALPEALRRLGIDIRIIMPEYPCVAETGLTSVHTDANALIPVGNDLFETHLHIADHRGVPLLLVRNREYFMRAGVYGDDRGDFSDNGERFGLFCRAVLRLLPQIDFQPDIIHLNDWHSALIATLLRSELSTLPFFSKMRTLLTLHNLAYSGCFERPLLDRLGLEASLAGEDQMGHGDTVSLLKGGIVAADRINTVSPSHAAEICLPASGHGLDAALCRRRNPVCGILNGIDTDSWNPACDPHIAAPYTTDNLAGKAACKNALQQELGLAAVTDRPLIGLVSRLDYQKGLDLLATAAPRLLTSGMQLAVLGCGDPRLLAQLVQLANERPDALAVMGRFDEQLARRIYAGSDMFLMPSRYEPCGLAQLIALRYGSVPVVHATGGLADTIIDAERNPQQGNGFSFNTLSASELAAGVTRAAASYRQPDRWHQIIRRGMNGDYSWHISAMRYLKLYRDIAGEK